MPELYRKPRRRRGGRAADFTTEQEVRQRCAELRSRYATAQEALASAEWRALRPNVARWVLASLAKKPGDDAWALRVADIYVRSPHFLPALPVAADD